MQIKPKVKKKSIVKDPESQKKPSLRVSQIVYGRESDGGRVRYLLDSKGRGTKREIPEKIVLIRWRQRVWEGYRFSGGRLGPNVWRGLAIALGESPNISWLQWPVDQIQEKLDQSRAEMGIFKSSVPAANVIHGLIHVCGIARLRKIMARHLDPKRGRSRGTPDLFLFAVDRTGRPTMGRFVEVKKPEEPASDDQRAEIDFLNDLGLHARVVRLIERTDGLQA